MEDPKSSIEPEEPSLNLQSLLEKLDLNTDDIKSFEKQLRKWKGRDDKTFMDMLRTVNRNHYLLNQMVDRKARILLSGSVLILSLIIGRNIANVGWYTWQFVVLAFFGVACFISILYSMFAVIPEKYHGSLNEESIKKKQGNPLFFGNFTHMREKIYEDAMLQMASDKDFIYRSMIQDIYHLGQVLEKKRRLIRTSLFVFIIGISTSLFLSFIFLVFSKS